MKRIGEIELMRFLTSMVILLFHSFYYTGCVSVVPGGFIGVEFFFLLSGYLMAAHLQRKQQTISLSSDLGTETYQYLRHRLISFWPELFIACCIGLCVFSWGHHFNAHDTLCMACDTLMGNVLLLHMASLAPSGVNGATWYLSSLLLSSAILYPLFRKYGHSPIWLVVALLLLGAHDPSSSSFLGVREWIGVTYLGNLRALGELTLGFSLYPLGQYLERVKVTKTVTLLLTLGKWIGYAVVLLFVLHPCGRLATITLLAMGGTIVLCFSRFCVDHTWYQHECIMRLGQFSLPLYLSHIFWAKNLETILPNLIHPCGKLIVYISVSLITAMAVMVLAKHFRRFIGCLFFSKEA